MASPSSPPASSSSRPSSPSPSRTGLRTLARMGTMLRRNSSGFGFGRQGLARSESKSSLRKEMPSDEGPAMPSPVAESPVREAAAVAAETGSPYVAIGPSPLTKSEDTTDAPPAAPAPSIPIAPAIPPAPPAPPTFVAERTSIDVPAPQPAEQPKPPLFQQPAVAPPPVAAVAPTPVRTVPEKREAVSPPSEHVAPPPQPVSQSSNPAPPPAKQERAADYFAWGNIPEQAKKKPSTSTIATEESIPVRSLASEPAPAPVPPVASAPKAEPAPAPAAAAEVSAPAVEQRRVDPYTASAADSFAWKDDSPVPSAKSMGKQPSREQFVASPEQSVTALSRSPSREQLVASPRSAALTLSPKASRSSIASSYGQVVNVSSGRRRVSVSVDPEEGKRGRSRSKASIRISFDDPYTDPFVDPPANSQVAIPKHALSPIYSVNFPDDSVEDTSVPTAMPSMPQPEPIAYPEPEPSVAQPDQHVPYETTTPVSMPLPELNEVTTSRAIRQAPSGYSIGTSTVGATDFAPHETNERLPLLPRMPVPDIGTSKSTADPPAFNDIDITITHARGIAWPSMERSFKTLGWTDYILPDSSLYYFHREYRVTTDVDLRNIKKLDAVTGYLDQKRPGETVLPPLGWELWLRDSSKHSFDFVPSRSWVNHRDRIVSLEQPTQPIGGSAPPLSEDDRVDNEYRYWTYIEGHPAHEPLAPSAYAEAMDALTWCYTDCLLPSERTIPPAFSPQECQELMGLLRSDSNGSPGNTIVRTRIVARVLIRQVQWRQHYFRPAKPLPGDATRGSAPANHRVSFRRAFMDVIMSILCLGIPYLFMHRSSHHRLDEESGVRNQGAMLVIGACACLVAAVILSASVTLLTLPGLDDIARLAGIIAILFSASSMISSVVALFKYKSDLERTVVYVGGEGLMVLSRRSIVMSLPLVFLAWAIAAFITGITLYSFRGVTLTSKAIIKQPFVDYTHWAVVGSLGALAGILLVSMFAARR